MKTIKYQQLLDPEIKDILNNKTVGDLTVSGDKPYIDVDKVIQILGYKTEDTLIFYGFIKDKTFYVNCGYDSNKQRFVKAYLLAKALIKDDVPEYVFNGFASQLLLPKKFIFALMKQYKCDHNVTNWSEADTDDLIWYISKKAKANYFTVKYRLINLNIIVYDDDK